MKCRRLISLIIVIGASICLFPFSAVFADIELSSDTSITITEEGPFDTAEGLLSELLENNLLLTLGKTDLSGSGDKVAFVIRTRATRWHELPRGAIGDITDVDAFEITISITPQPTVTITGQTPTAAGYGVMFFLEEYLELLWAMPGDLGVCVPKQRSFRLEEGSQRVRPWVVARVLSGIVLRDRNAVPLRQRELAGVVREQRSFFLADDFFKSLRLHQEAVTHNMIKIFPVEECRAKYPDLFPMMDDGTRFVPQLKESSQLGGKNAYQSWHPCYTNPKAVEAAIEKGRTAFREGRLFYSLGINDGRRVRCQCDQCREAGWPHSYYRFVNQVADALADHHPPHTVGVLAYGDVGIPPADLKLRDNVLVNVAGVRKSLWESLAPLLGTYEYIYGAGYVIPNLPLDVIAENMRYYQAHDLKMYRAEFYPVWAFDAPKAFIISRLLSNPNHDVRQLLRTFCDRAFGDAGEPMYRFYEHIASIRRDDAQSGKFTPMWDRVWPFREPLQFVRCPKDLHERLFACLNDAKRKDLTDREHKRLAMVEAFTEFSAVYYEMYRLKEDVFHGRGEPDAAISLATKLRARKEAVFAEFRMHPEWFRGSSVDVKGLHDRVWPTRRIEQELGAAIVTAAVQLDDPPAELARYAGPHTSVPSSLMPLRKEEHPWYKPAQHVRMEITSSQRGEFSIENAPVKLINDHLDPRRNGQPKAQWLHGLARDLAVSPGLLYAMDLHLEGRQGTFQVRVQGTMRSEARDRVYVAHTTHAFAEERGKTTMRIVFDPLRYLEQSSASNRDAGSSQTLNLQLHLLWRPHGLSSLLGGNVRLDQVTHER